MMVPENIKHPLDTCFGRITKLTIQPRWCEESFWAVETIYY
jgi:hypothetical protein